MTPFDLGEIVRIRRRKDLLCMYDFTNYIMTWMNHCEEKSRITRIVQTPVSSSDIKAYGFTGRNLHYVFALEGIENIMFFSEDLEHI